MTEETKMYRIEIAVAVRKDEWIDDSTNMETIKSFFEYGALKFKERYVGIDAVRTSISKVAVSAGDTSK